MASCSIHSRVLAAAAAGALLLSSLVAPGVSAEAADSPQVPKAPKVPDGCVLRLGSVVFRVGSDWSAPAKPKGPPNDLAIGRIVVRATDDDESGRWRDGSKLVDLRKITVALVGGRAGKRTVGTATSSPFVIDLDPPRTAVEVITTATFRVDGEGARGKPDYYTMRYDAHFEFGARCSMKWRGPA